MKSILSAMHSWYTHAHSALERDGDSVSPCACVLDRFRFLLPGSTLLW
jgi:hypothetical protein